MADDEPGGEATKGLRLAWIGLLLPGAVWAGLLATPAAYAPDRSWPVIVSTQSNPAPEAMKASPFFLLHAGGQGVECSQKIDAGLEELAGPDVAALDLHLTDRLVDTNKPIVVVRGDAVLYDGRAEAKLTVKLRDAETAIRGNRRPLWERMTEAGRKAGFAYNPIDLKKALETAPTVSKPQ